MNKVQTAAHMEGQQLWTDLTKANKEIKRLQSRIELLEGVYEAAKKPIADDDGLGGLTYPEWFGGVWDALDALAAVEDEGAIASRIAQGQRSRKPV